mmetsp:Transcript_30688/g.66932  ORF Transcript_30688/g.66932 Transcript_30688/m.66932 type:complete len:611 (+) Transcript_30688:168-2000(+)
MDIQGYLETVRLLPRPSDAGGDAEGVRHDGSEAAQQLSINLVLVSLGFMYSVHNLIAPNMTAIAQLFHFNNFQRDAYIGGELTLFFYCPGVLGALFAGILSGMVDRRLLLAALALVTSIACLFTTRVGTFDQLLWARAVTGFGVGGSLPVVYSLVGDWFPARKRASATAMVTAASGAGVFAGQCVATLMGTSDWRWPFLVVAVPSMIMAVAIWYLMEEPVRGGQEDGIETLKHCQSAGLQYMPALSGRHMRALLNNRTNHLVILQAFPGNIPWGVIIVYMHDFLVQDLGMSRSKALGAITMLAASAFAGILTGGVVGEKLHGSSSKQLALFAGLCNIFRAVPFYILFGWTRYVGPATKSEGLFISLLIVGGFVATLASPITGAMLLNVNLPETRGSVMAMYSVLDDLSKGFGTFFVAMIVEVVGGRSVAYQLSLLLWVFTGVALLYTQWTYDEDEELMRQQLDEAAMESMVLISKQRAASAIRDRAKAAGEAHFAQKSLGARQQQQQSRDHWLPSIRSKAAEVLAAAGVNIAAPDDADGPLPLPAGKAAPRGYGASLPAQSGQPESRSAAPVSAPSRTTFNSGIGRSQADRDRLHRAARLAAEAVGPRGP